MRIGFGGSNLFTVNHSMEAVELIVHAEQLGFHSSWPSDLTRDVYSIMAVAALETKKILLGTGVTNPYSRHPATSARAIATIHELSGGRAIFGIGTGNPLEWIPQMGFEKTGAYGRCREATIILKRLLAGESVNFEGEFFRLEGVHLGLKVEHKIPIYIAGQGPRILEMAGELADGAITMFAYPELLELALRSVRRGASKVGERSVDFATEVHLWAGGDRAKNAVRPSAALKLLLTPYDWLRSVGISAERYERIKEGYPSGERGGPHLDPMLEAEYARRCSEYVTDEIVDMFSIVGEPRECIKRLEALVEVGLTEFIAIVPPTTEMDVKKRNLRWMADNIMNMQALS